MQPSGHPAPTKVSGVGLFARALSGKLCLRSYSSPRGQYGQTKKNGLAASAAEVLTAALIALPN